MKFNDNINYHINPTGKFVIGGPHRHRINWKKNPDNMVVNHGGGAFSGKDPSKLIEVLHMQQDILQKIFVLQVFVMKYLFR